MPSAAPRPEGNVRRLTLAAIGTGLVIRLLVAASTPLLPDESYYWEWSRHLAAGYFDHPPAIAWLIAAGTRLFGTTPFGVRFLTALAGTGAIAGVALIAESLGGERSGLRAAVLLLCMPLAIPGLAIATTDAPGLLPTAVALFCVMRAVEAPAGSAPSSRWWLAAWAAFGAGLLAKLTVAIVGAATGAALLARPSLRRHLRSPGPWVAVLCAAIVAFPLLWWNAHHDWVSVRFQLGHGLGAPRRGSVLGREAALAGGQLALVSPGLLVLAVIATMRALRREERDARFLLAAVAGLVATFFIWSAARRPVEPNWPAPAVIAAIPLLASSGLTSGRMARAAAALGAVMVAVSLVQLVVPVLPLPASRDPVARAHGWAALAGASDSARAAIARRTRRDCWLAADRYQDAAEIALLSANRPTVFALNLGGRRNEYDIWPGFDETARPGDCLVAALDTGAAGGAISLLLARHFDVAAPARLVALRRGADTIAVRQLWRFEGWKGSWPMKNPGRR